MKVPSIAGEPALTTPLFLIHGMWHYRWPISPRMNRLTVPIEWFQLNGLDPTPKVGLHLPDNTPVMAEMSKYGTSFHLEPAQAVLEASEGKSGDYIFVGVDKLNAISIERISKQKMGRAHSALRRALLLAGHDDDFDTISGLLWAFGAEEESAGLEEALQIVAHRSDGLIQHALEEYRSEAEKNLPADLSSVFDDL